MALTPRTKKYTDYAYLITNPASENDVRSQMDGAVDEVFTTVDSALTTTNTNIGTIASLATTIKTSIVNAINELVTNIGALTSLSTTVKTSLVAAVNELFTNKANRTQEAWIAPTLLNGWVNYGAGYSTVAYYKDDFGTVHLRGLIKSGVVGQPAFVLPIGYKALYGKTFAIWSNTSVGRLLVDESSTGNVTIVSGSNVSASLDGITFRAEA